MNEEFENSYKSFWIFLGLGILVLLLIIGVSFILGNKEQTTDYNEIESINNNPIDSPNLVWNNLSLLDSTTYNTNSNTCTGSRYGMEITINNCLAQDVDGKDIEQNVKFKWSGANAKNISWIFVYDQELDSGSISALTNISRTIQQSQNTYVNNYLVDKVVSYINLTQPPNYCDLGNLNNSRYYKVTRNTNNATTYNQTVCFTEITIVNSTAFRISGNADVLQDKTIWETKYVDVTNQIQFLGTGLLNDDRSYYKVNSVQFNPNEIIDTKWVYTPKNKTKSGKFHILGYETETGLINSIQNDLYLYIDPWWNSSFSKKKAITISTTDPTNRNNVSVLLNISYDSDMQADFDDIRFVDSSETTELGYWFYNNSYIASNSVSVYVRVLAPINTSANTTIYMYYGNSGVTTTSSVANAGLFGDDFATLDTGKWQSNNIALYSVSGGNLIASADSGVNNALLTKQNLSDYIMEIRGKTDNGATDGTYIPTTATTLNWNTEVYIGTTTGAFRTTIGGDSTGGTVTNDVFYRYIFGLNTTSAYANFTNDDRKTQQYYKTASVVRRGGWAGFARYTSGTFTSDWIFVRKYVAIEPTATFGSEEGGLSSPTFTFVSQTPSDLTTGNTAGGVRIAYNVTGGTVNTSTVDLFWLTNSTLLPNQTSWSNGTASHVGFSNVAVYNRSNITDTYYFNIDDNILPATYLLSPAFINNVVHSEATMQNDNDLIKVMVLNMTNLTKYNILEYNIYNETSTSDSLRIYYCNSSYTTGSIINSNCANVFNQLASVPFNHTHNLSTHWTVPLTVNTTTGTLGGIKITKDLGYFVFRGRQTDGWIYRYVPTISRTGGTQTSGNLGNTYADLSGTLDYHLHQFSDDATLNYYVCGNFTTSGIYNCSTTRVDLLNQSALPPSTVIIYSPNGTTLSTSIFINYSASLSPVGNPIVQYNITLLNEDDSPNLTITTNNSQNLNYTWTNTNITNGTFNVHVTAIDSAGLYSIAESENFNISATFNTTTTVGTSPPSPIDYGTASNWSCLNNYNLATEMWVNGVNLTSQKGQSIVRSAGTYTINCSANTVGGYIGSSQTSVYVINKVAAVLSIGVTPSINEDYGVETTVTGTGCDTQLSCSLERNGATVSNPNVATLNAGTYIYNYSTPGNQNYSAGSANLTLTINKINPMLTLSITPSTTVTNGTQTTATGAGCPDSTCLLRRNGVLVTNPETTTLAIGSYVYNYSYAGSTNYNIYSITSTLTVNPILFAGTNGTINFTANNLSQSLSFQVPYQFVTQAYMNLTSKSFPVQTTTATKHGYTGYDGITNYTLSNTYVNNSLILASIISVPSVPDAIDTYNNFTIPDSCLNTTSKIVKIINANGSASLPVDIWCLNNTNSVQYIGASTAKGSYVNGTLYYNISSNNVNISIGSSQIDYLNLPINTPNRTQNFYSILNSYLSGCTYVGNYCIVPITFNATTTSVVNYSDVLFSNYGFIENSQTYNTTTTETSYETFILNMQYDSSEYSLAGTLYYNNTAYTATDTTTGFNGSIVARVNIPIVNSITNKSFYWTVALTNSTGTYHFNSTTKNQTINPVSLIYCPPGYGNNRTLNFTFYAESNLSKLSSTVFAGTFSYYIGDGSIKKTLSINNLSTEEIGICTSNLTTVNLIINADLEYSKTGYVERDYYLVNYSLPNTLTPVYLYLLPEEELTTFILKVQDQSLAPVANAFIYIQRYYPSDNEYRTTQIVETDDNGETVGFYKTETVDYRHIIVKDGVTLLTTSKQKIVPKSVPYTLIFTVGEALAVPWDNFEESPNITTTLIFNKTTNIITYTYDTDEVSNARLYVINLFDGNSSDVIVCDTTESGSSGTITCNLSSYTGQFIARGYIDNVEIKIINVKITTARDTFGLEGVFIAFFIIMVAGFAFIWNPSAGIVAINASLIFVSMTGLITLSPVFIFGSIAISILALWLLKS